jgi:competence protein ComEC
LLNLLAAIAWIFLLWDPRQLLDASFQLSFGALAAIAGLALPIEERWIAPLARGLKRLETSREDPRAEPNAAAVRVEVQLLAETCSLLTRIPYRLCCQALGAVSRIALAAAALLLSSAAVQVGLAAAFIAYFHRYAFTALAANLGVVLALNTAIATGFAATLTAFPPAVWATRVLIAFATWCSEASLRFEPALRIPDPPWWIVAPLIAALAGMALLLRRQSRWSLAAAAASSALVAIAILHPFPAAAREGHLELTAIDVGQGDSLLVTAPDGARMLVDAGGVPSYGNSLRKPFDIGAEVVTPYLLSRGIRSLDVLAITHGHADHMGGARAILEDFRPRELWISGLGRSPEFDAVLDAARKSGTRIVIRRRGERIPLGGAEFAVVAPPEWAENEGAPRNNDSLGLTVRFGGRTFLLPGDMERSVEESIAAEHPTGHIDVLKVAHHGGRTSTTMSLIEAATPSIAVISSGAGNRYGHPHPEVLDRLASAKTAILRTDRDGRVTILTDGRSLEFDTYRWSHSR